MSSYEGHGRNRRLIPELSDRPECATVTQSHASEQLGVHVNTIAAMLDDGRLEPVEIGTGGGPCHHTCRRVAVVSLEAHLGDSTNRRISVQRPDDSFRYHDSEDNPWPTVTLAREPDGGKPESLTPGKEAKRGSWEYMDYVPVRLK